MEWSLNESFNRDFDYHATKSEMAAAIISNCGAKSGRLDYIKKLQSFLKIHIFGKCGKTCPNTFKSNNQTADCREIISKVYMFYFAMENSLCTDYITEKVRMSLHFKL